MELNKDYIHLTQTEGHAATWIRKDKIAAVYIKHITTFSGSAIKLTMVETPTRGFTVVESVDDILQMLTDSD